MSKHEYICVECGIKFEASQPAKYCSGACKAKHLNRAKAMFQCVVCGRMFEGTRNQKPRFCSAQCAATCRKEILANPDSPLAKYMTVHPHKVIEYDRVCSNCGAHFKTTCSTTTNRQCPECAATYGKRWYAKNKAWNSAAMHASESELDKMLAEQGIDTVVVGSAREAVSEAQNAKPLNQTREETNARRRRVYAKKRALGLIVSRDKRRWEARAQLLDKFGHKCALCGYSLFDEALQCHHIDMDRTHNELSNYILLCANCHTLLHARIKANWAKYGEDKITGILHELELLTAEVKARNEAGKPDRATRTEGSEESGSGATRSSTTRTAMSYQEALPFD